MESETDKVELISKLQIQGFSEEDAIHMVNLKKRYLKWEEFEAVIHSKKRKICRPASPVLIRIHEMLHREVFSQMPVTEYAAAFVVGKGVRYLLHKVARDNPNFLWRIDLKNFFDTITKESLVNYLENEAKWDRSVASFISGLVTYKDRIPVGGTCSGEITNIVLSRMHDDIAAAALVFGIKYAAYADDLFFWGKDSKGVDDYSWDKLKVIIKEVIKKHGLMLNYKKIIRFHDGPLSILGAVIINGVPYPGPGSEERLANMITKYLSGVNVGKKRVSGLVSWLWSINNDHFIRVWVGSINRLITKYPKANLPSLFPREFRQHLT
jgi:hypothetical protein